ncbi:MAG: response regulator transcription factor [Desulfobacter sp.]|nr:MAG: response regulator transcription factor [Desulfobacter sp.]
MADKKITILLADDHEILRHSLKKTLEQHQEFKVVGDTNNGLDAVQLANLLYPKVVLMDISMPDLNGVEATKKIIKSNPDTNVIALSMMCDEYSVKRMLAAGARGFILKSCPFEELYNAIKKVNSGDRHLCSEALDFVIKTIQNPESEKIKSVAEKLTFRELNVLQLIAEGNTSIEISNKLEISKRTVDIHRSNIMSKLNTRTIAGLTKIAIKEGLTDL